MLNSEMQCAQCRASAKFRCGRCENIFYCSPECQKQNFAQHRIACGPMEWTAEKVTEFFQGGHEIGRGGFGRVFANEQICPAVLVKYSRSQAECTKFETEYEIAVHIAEQTEKLHFRDDNVAVVKVIKEISNLRDISQGQTWCAMVMQRILRPRLQFGADNTLSYQLYLGNAPEIPPHTSIGRGNYIGPMQAEQLLGRARVEALAMSMGRLIGFLHYGAKVDATDMEYLLGSTTEEPDRLRVFAVDFDRVRKIDPAAEDPHNLEWSLAQEAYFPTFEDMALYKNFKRGYLEQAKLYNYVTKASEVIELYENDLSL